MGKKQGKSESSQGILKAIYMFLKNRWIVNTIILFIPTVWFPLVIDQWGGALFLKDSNSNEYTVVGKVLTISICFLVLLVSILNNYTSKKDEDIVNAERQQLQAVAQLFESISEKTHNICSEKYRLLLSKLATLSNSTDKTSLYDAKHQIEFILDQLAAGITDITKLKSKNVSVTLAYLYCENGEDYDKLIWINEQNTGGGNTISQLPTNRESTFYQIFMGIDDFIFYNDKKDAIADRKYIPNTKDKSNGNNGSIVCKRIIVTFEGKTIIKSILSIATDKRFQPNNDADIVDNVKRNMYEYVIPEFEKRLQIELLTSYLQNKIGFPAAELTAAAHIDVATCSSAMATASKVV